MAGYPNTSVECHISSADGILLLVYKDSECIYCYDGTEENYSNFIESGLYSGAPRGSENQNKTDANNTSGIVDDIIRGIDKVCKNSGDAGYQGYEIRNGDKANFLLLKFGDEGFAEGYYTNSVSWRALKSNADDLSSTCRNLFVEAGYDNWHVGVFLMNDINNDNYLYASVDGIEYIPE